MMMVHLSLSFCNQLIAFPSPSGLWVNRWLQFVFFGPLLIQEQVGTYCHYTKGYKKYNPTVILPQNNVQPYLILFLNAKILENSHSLEKCKKNKEHYELL